MPKNKISVTIKGNGNTGVFAGGSIGVSKPLPEKSNPIDLREWWHSVLQTHGKFSCCAFVLALPTDIQAIKYLTDFGKELDLISGKNCLVIALSSTQLMQYGFDESQWKISVNEQVSNGQSLKVAELFNIKFSTFPCMVIFQDVRSAEHLVVSLQKMDVDEISQKMRSIFSVIHFAVANKLNPLVELQRQRKKESLQKTGLSIIGNLQSFAGKTFETAMETMVQSMIKNA